MTSEAGDDTSKVAQDRPAPDFELHDQADRLVTLSQWRGNPVVLYFYPKDDTPGCTTEACAFRDAAPEYQALGAQVLGISPDSSRSHAKFAAKYSLGFPLLADVDRAVSERYGVWREKTSFGKTFMGVVRTTFLIDASGIVRKIYPNVKVKGHSEAILAALETLRASRG